MELLKIQNVKKVYTTKLGLVQCVALKNVSFTVLEGEFVAIMGASGSGKTTLLNIIGCLDGFDSGSYLLNGQPVEKMGDRRLAAIRNREIGFVIQDFALIAKEDVLFNVMLPLYFSRTGTAKMKRLAQDTLELVGLADQAGKKVSQLSGGQKQRVAVARALVSGGGILLADEPTGALDSVTGRGIMELISRINSERGTTVVLITHDAEVASYARRRIALSDGAVISDGAGDL